MARRRSPSLTDAEARVMAVVWQKGTASVADVVAAFKKKRAVSYSTVQTILRILEGKGYVRHEEESLRYVYIPVVQQHEVGRSALKQLMDAFYDGSMENVVAALLGSEGSKLSQKRLDRIAEMVEKARKGAKR